MAASLAADQARLLAHLGRHAGARVAVTSGTRGAHIHVDPALPCATIAALRTLAVRGLVARESSMVRQGHAHAFRISDKGRAWLAARERTQERHAG